jgi:long-subunit acyl-CoA synthetase (AMP-forming)
MGMEVVFSRGADRISAEMTQFQPAIITAVPRLFEVLRARIEAQLEKDGGLKQALFRRALALGLRVLILPSTVRGMEPFLRTLPPTALLFCREEASFRHCTAACTGGARTRPPAGRRGWPRPQLPRIRPT